MPPELQLLHSSASMQHLQMHQQLQQLPAIQLQQLPPVPVQQMQAMQHTVQVGGSRPRVAPLCHHHAQPAHAAHAAHAAHVAHAAHAAHAARGNTMQPLPHAYRPQP
ncbi:hypothetical protein O0L34_g7665 [Tuta absoluta]|nr:hypothetical protein O0L34_g7665 [Tuta absoluta]